MFSEEAEWIGKTLEQIDVEKFPIVANIGSSTEEFRKEIQPHIEEKIFAPLQQRGFCVQHIDVKKDKGVDIVADITNKDFGDTFRDSFDVVICTNLLEHVTDIKAVARHLYECCTACGYLLITVPYKYKKHLDPIDNMFRPKPAEIKALFAANSIEEIDSGIITVNEKKYYRVKRSRLPLWGYREILFYNIGIRHKVSGILLKVNKGKN
jgi:SAM-dependent methyltransferase